MITPLVIAQEMVDGTVRAIQFAGRGSTIAAAGRVLDACYTTADQVGALLDMGDIVILGIDAARSIRTFGAEPAATYQSAEALRSELRGVHAALLWRGEEWYAAVSIGPALQRWMPLREVLARTLVAA